MITFWFLCGHRDLRILGNWLSHRNQGIHGRNWFLNRVFPRGFGLLLLLGFFRLLGFLALLRRSRGISCSANRERNVLMPKEIVDVLSD